MYTIVAQNTNYSWLKGTKCCSMNNNLARIQPAKAGLFKTKISNKNLLFSFGWFSLEFENRWNTGKISLSDILLKSKLPLPSLCCVCSLNASSWLGGNYFQILAVVCAPPRSGQHAHSRALFFTHSLTKKVDLFRKSSIVPLGWTVDGQLAFEIPRIVAHWAFPHLRPLHFLHPGNATNNKKTDGKRKEEKKISGFFKVKRIGFIVSLCHGKRHLRVVPQYQQSKKDLQCMVGSIRDAKNDKRTDMDSQY